MRRLALAFIVTACTPVAVEPAPPPATTTAEATTAKVIQEGTPPSEVARPVACGPMECTLYASPVAALTALLEKSDPRVLAFGEAHGQADVEVASSTKRFTQELLPLFSGRASDLVLELLIADDACKRATDKVVENVERPVTRNQANTNKNEFVVLGNRSKELGIRPHVLRPSCEEYNAIANAGADGVEKMLTMIAALTDDLVKRILERNARENVDKLVLAYGGAMHNDVEPREGREGWSYAAALKEATGDRYVELDIFVPELIRDTDTWKAFSWYPHYDRTIHGDKVAVFRTGDRSFVMIFPVTR